MKIRKPSTLEWLVFWAIVAWAIYTVIDIIISNHHQFPRP